jgi:hypothetical protein
VPTNKFVIIFPAALSVRAGKRQKKMPGFHPIYDRMRRESVDWLNKIWSRVVGWNFSSHPTAADAACKAYEVAACNHKAEPGMICHFDRGVQYASGEFRNTLAKMWCSVCREKRNAGTTPWPNGDKRARVKISNKFFINV